jgi:methyl-accepting chemotaxis protein
MIKAALNIAVVALLALMAFNGYLAVRHLKAVQSSAALTGESTAIQANIAEISQDLTDMETGQRGFLLTEDPAYLQPYTDAKARIGARFADLRSELANRGEQERSLESQLETLAASKQAEMEKTITLRQQGYRHRAFVMVNTNEGKNYMDQARAALASLSALENANFAKIEQERNASLSRAFSQTILVNLVVLALTALLFVLVRFQGRGVEREAAESKGMLAARDAELGRFTSVLSNQARSEIGIVEENARWLQEKYEGFLPRQGSEYMEQIRTAAAELERLRKVLVGEVSHIHTEAA